MNIQVVLGGVTLPTPHLPFKEIPRQNAVDTETLDGTLYTDFINQKRTWSIYYAQLSKADYDIIRGIYNNQFTNETYPTLVITYYNVSTTVKMNINEKNIRNDGLCIRDVEITLIERFAFS